MMVSKVVLAMFLMLFSSTLMFPVSAVQTPSTLRPLWSSKGLSDIALLKMSDDGSVIVTGGENLELLSKEGAKKWNRWRADVLTLTPDGSLIAAGMGNTLLLFDKSGTQILEKDAESIITALAISDNGRRMVASDNYKNLYIFDRSGETINKTKGVEPVAISFDGDLILEDGLVAHNRTGYILWQTDIREFQENPRFVEITRDYSTIFAATPHAILSVDVGGELLWKYYPKMEIISFSVSPNGMFIASGSEENKIFLLDKSGNLLWTYVTKGRVLGVDVSSDGYVLAGSYDKNVYLLDKTGKLVASTPLDNYVKNVAITSDGSFAVAATTRYVYGYSTLEVEKPTTEPTQVMTTVTQGTISPTEPVTSLLTPPITTTVPPTQTSIPPTPRAPLVYAPIIGVIIVFLLRVKTKNN